MEITPQATAVIFPPICQQTEPDFMLSGSGSHANDETSWISVTMYHEIGTWKMDATNINGGLSID